MKSYEGLFTGWKMDKFHVWHTTQSYSLWIANGFVFFKDDIAAGRGRNHFLAGLRPWTRWRIWRELKRERRRRAYNRLKEVTA